MLAVAEQQQEVLRYYNPNETKATRTSSDCLCLNIDDNLDTPAEAVQKAVHTMTLILWVVL